MGGASVPYLLGSEIPNAAVREKTQALGTSWNVVWAFVTNYVIPYMIDSIHFNVGWVFGSLSVLALVFTFFFLPETKVSLASFVGLVYGNLTWHNAIYRASPLKRSMLFSMFRSIHSAAPRFISQTLSAGLIGLVVRKRHLAQLSVTVTSTLRRTGHR